MNHWSEFIHNLNNPIDVPPEPDADPAIKANGDSHTIDIPASVPPPNFVPLPESYTYPPRPDDYSKA